LVRQSPDNKDFRASLANTSTDLANVLIATGHAAEAQVACDRAIAINEDLVRAVPHGVSHAAYLADALLRRGQARRAQTAVAGAAEDWRRCAETIAELNSPWAELHVLAACCDAGLSDLAGLPDSDVSKAEGEAEAEKAMELLRKAIGMGNRDIGWLRTERGLDPIRGRDDFRLMMMDLVFPSQPFARTR
jgi:eukaryotic-like serine/threonine-protein kinase